MEKYIKYGALILLAEIVSLSVEKEAEYSVKKETYLQDRRMTQFQPEMNNSNNRQISDRVQKEVTESLSVTQSPKRYTIRILTKNYSGNISKTRNKVTKTSTI